MEEIRDEEIGKRKRASQLGDPFSIKRVSEFVTLP